MSRLLQCALSVLIATAAAAGSDNWQASVDSAAARIRVGEPEAALPWAERGLLQAKSQRGEADTSVARALKIMGVCNYLLDRHDSAEVLYRQALTVWEGSQGSDTKFTAEILNNLGLIKWRQGKYPEAEALYHECLTATEQAVGRASPDYAASLDNLALLSWSMGKFAAARDQSSEALAVREERLGAEDIEVARSLHTLALIQFDLGDYAAAEQNLTRSLSIRRSELPADHPDIPATLNTLARVYLNQGRFDEALVRFHEALEIREQATGVSGSQTAESLNNLAITYALLGRPQEVESLLSRSLAIAQEHSGVRPTQLALAAFNLADFYLLQGRLTDAEPLYREAIEIWRGSRSAGADPEYARGLIGWADLCLRQGRLEEARANYMQALKFRERVYGLDHPEVASALESTCGFYRSERDGRRSFETAERAFRIRWLNFADGARVMPERDALAYSYYMRAAAGLYLSCQTDTPREDKAAVAAGAEIILSCKGQVSDMMYARLKSMAAEPDSLTQKLAEACRLTRFQLSSLYIAGAEDADPEAYRHELDSLGQLARDQEAELARRSASFRKTHEASRVDLRLIQELLPDNSLLVEYIQFEYSAPESTSVIPNYAVLLISKRRDPILLNLGPASEIDLWIDRYRQHFLRVSAAGRLPSVADQSEYHEINRELYRRVWKAVEPYTVDRQLVLIAPDGGLNLLSFAGLMDSAGQYLVEKSALQYLSSGRDLIRLQTQPQSGRGLLALGDPDYDASPDSLGETPSHSEADTLDSAERSRGLRSGCADFSSVTVPRLPGTRREVEAIASNWRTSSREPATVWLGAEASEGRFKREAGGHRVLHLATHGYFLDNRCALHGRQLGKELSVDWVGDNPLLTSCLMLSGANRHVHVTEDSAGEDGILTALEVTALDLSGTDLVVLSACETGVGEVKSGEGVYGLRRAFLMAGARTVISALWPVSDEFTAELMGSLHDRQGQTLAETMRRIQLKMIADLRAKKKTDHPFAWAGFIALGDWK